jgi:hypothetical protein
VWQCAGSVCSLYEVDDKCTSRCSSCGTLCDAFPVSDLASLQLYKSKGCTTVTGDLFIRNLPFEATRTLLLDALKTVTEIRGKIYFMDNEFIVSMLFFENLKRVEGIFYLNNPSLVDARMPMLQSMPEGTEVEGCHRLCPARYTTVGASPNDNDCAVMVMKFTLRLTGDVDAQWFPLLEAIFVRVVANVTHNAVCDG